MDLSSGVGVVGGDERAASSVLAVAAAEPATVASTSEPTACAAATLASAPVCTPEPFTHSR